VKTTPISVPTARTRFFVWPIASCSGGTVGVCRPVVNVRRDDLYSERLQHERENERRSG
jgi:hypothetical protein